MLEKVTQIKVVVSEIYWSDVNVYGELAHVCALSSAPVGNNSKQTYAYTE